MAHRCDETCLCSIDCLTRVSGDTLLTFVAQCWPSVVESVFCSESQPHYIPKELRYRVKLFSRHNEHHLQIHSVRERVRVSGRECKIMRNQNTVVK